MGVRVQLCHLLSVSLLLPRPFFWKENRSAGLEQPRQNSNLDSFHWTIVSHPQNHMIRLSNKTKTSPNF